MDSEANGENSNGFTGYYECGDCRHREWSVSRLSDCPVCGYPMTNIGVARE